MNRCGCWSGWLDTPLTEKGREIVALGNELGIIANTTFDRIYASDLSRARSTAELALPGCSYIVDPTVREINVGSISGKPLGAVRDSNNQPLNKDGYAAFGGESNAQFRLRIECFMKRIQQENCENIAVFSHGGVLRKFLEITMGMPLPRSAVICRNCAVAVFEVNNGLWMMHSWINLY